MQVGVIGLNHKQAGIELREALSKLCIRRFQPGVSIHGEHAIIPLNTCNRTELYFSSSCLSDTQSYILRILKNGLPHRSDQEFYSFFGIDCFYHLCKVTTGFDSARLAETEIQFQVKASYHQAQKWISLPFDLHYLFQKALKVGKEIRNKWVLQKPFNDLEHAALHFAQKILPQLENSSILLVGASKTNLKIASFLKKKQFKQITLVNRTDEKSKAICLNEGFTFLPWQKKSQWVHFDWVIVATTADTIQLHRQDLLSPLLPPSPPTKLLLDLSVPRNIDPNLTTISSIVLINIDEIHSFINKRSLMTQENKSEAEILLASNAEKYFTLFRNKKENSRTYLNSSLTLPGMWVK